MKVTKASCILAYIKKLHFFINALQRAKEGI